MDIIGRMFMAIVGVTMGVVIVIISSFSRSDDMIQKYVENTTNTFIDETKQMGYISPNNYKEFARKINNTGYIYDIKLEHGSLVSYPDGTGEYKDHYLIHNKSDILETMFPDGSVTENDYSMKSGDELNISVVAKEETMLSKIYNSFTGSAHTTMRAIRYMYGVTIGNTKR